MSEETQDQACCICRHNQMIVISTYCNHPKQRNQKLKKSTRYNDSCPLFENRDESFYTGGIPIEKK